MIFMNVNQEKLSINPVTAFSNGTDTFFTAHLPENDLQLRIDYIDDSPIWVEGSSKPTERAEEIGRLIEEYDGR